MAEKARREEGPVRMAATADAPAVGRLLHDFNTEFDQPSPGPVWIGDRVAELIDAGGAEVLLVGAGPEGLALLRYRAALWSHGQVAYLEELYVAPPQRGRGLGRALMEAVLARARERDCDRVEVATGTTDTAARGLYEAFGFTNLEDAETRMLFYEREL